MAATSAEELRYEYSMVMQAKSKWCWAACAENSVRGEMAAVRDQWAAVKKIKGTIFNPYPNEGGTLDDMIKAAEYISDNTESYGKTSGIKSYEFLKKEINIGNFTILTLGRYSGGTRVGGHAITMTGYKDTGNGKYVYIHDPLDGTIQKWNYTHMCNGNVGNGIYDGTVWNAE